MHNPVFRLLEGRARGFFPFLGFEVAAAAGVAAVFFCVDLPLSGFAAGGGLLAALTAWRLVDHDRSDYLQIFVRRHATRRRAYSLCAPDRRHRPFPHRPRRGGG